jgi:hypothetical protein
MKTLKILALLLTAVGVTSLASAQDLWHGSIDVGYQSRNIWRGFEIYPNNHSGLTSEIDMKMGDTGFGFNVSYDRAVNGGFENQQWLPISVYYENRPYAYNMNYQFGWTYYSHPDEPKNASDMQELYGSFEFPSMLGRNLTPSYTIAYLWPARGDSYVRSNSGWMHILGLTYTMPIAGLGLDGTSQDVRLVSELVYNDGVAPGSAAGKNGYLNAKAVDHDWSHAVFGLETDYKLTRNLSLTPGVYFQSSMDKSVNSGDEYWAALSLKYSF